ncbi:immunoglobulin domain-containing protein [Opitutus sp. ER46]|uniref:immunoglobulin domain-containing protein n=1 Tax=Opitutus sp. ER46 TaxID=2161864 RepID=UPI001304E043|nr:immunoglobulin domain-containing protein [Opitutus sp. ER46]
MSLSQLVTRRAIVALMLLATLVVAPIARAYQGVTLQTQLGNPSNATADATNHTHYLIQRDQYVLDYNDTNFESNWVSWSLTSSDRGGTDRTDKFAADPLLPSGFTAIDQNGYKGSGYDRGHMCPSADRTTSVADNEATFFMTNMVPQTADNNQGVWNNFEGYCRDLAAAGNELLIISGPGGFGSSKIASGVAIPGYTWKIVTVVPLGSGSAVSRITAAGAASIRVIAIKVPNIAGIRSNPWQNYVTSAAQLESDTGLTFFTELDTASAATLRAKVDGSTTSGLPVISLQPAGQSAAAGGMATFSVTATDGGNPPLSYQWFKGEDAISGATNATFTLTNVQATDVAGYSVRVTNTVGFVTSSVANLVVTGLPPAITSAPLSQTVGAGANAVFSVTASGSPTLTYQWRKDGNPLGNGTEITGATTPTLTLTNVQAAAQGSYDVVVTNSVSSATSAAVTLTVTATAPTITSQPASQSLGLGSTATFVVVAKGSAPLSYQWRKGGADLTTNSSATTPTLVITGMTADDAGDYDVVVTNTAGHATSSVATLSVASATEAAVFYTGGTYSQNFDSLPSATGNFTLTGTGPINLSAAPISATGLGGWSFAKTMGNATVALFNVGTGSGNTGSLYSFGAAAATERALGALASNTLTCGFGVTLVNQTGHTITEFTISYTGEQWRRGNTTAGSQDTLAFGYQVGGTDLATGTFTDVATLKFVSPITTASAVALDGNLAANQAVISGSVTGITWNPGEKLILRWNDVNISGSDDGLAIDNFSFTTSTTGPVGPAVTATSPISGASDVALNSPVTITFNQEVNVTSGWVALTSSTEGSISPVIATTDHKTFTLTPPANYGYSDTIGVTVYGANVTSESTGLHPEGDYTFSFVTAAPVAPSITTPPANQTVAAGETATFTVVADGTQPLTYQWRKDGADLNITTNPSAATATLALANVQAGDMGSYDVVVSNGVLPVATSTGATLTVTAAAPTIVTQPSAVTVTAGEPASFSVTAKGTAPLAYQWRKDSTPISGATTATLSIAHTVQGDAGSYDVVVSNSVDAVTSSAAALVVNAAAAGHATYVGGTYTQDFDTLPAAGTFALTGKGPIQLDDGATINATGMAGWSFATYLGTSTVAKFTVSDGSSNSGSAFSFGASGATDRALGSLGSGSVASRFGVTFLNNSGQTITEFTLSYTGEQWRRGSAAANTLTFEYAVDATDLNTGSYAAATALNFVAPVATGSGAALDGNAAANRTAVTATVTGLNWAPGQTLTLRWNDVDDTGSDDGIGIDDLTFATPAIVMAAPTITTQPVPQIVTPNSTVTFSVVATGAPAPTYQWRKNGSALVDGTGIAGATTATLTLTGVTTAASGNYDVVVTNAAGEKTSDAAALTVAGFTPGNLVVVRVGDGSTGLLNTGNPVFLDEFTTTGTRVQSIALPAAVNGANQPLILSGTATSEGLMTRSVDGRYLVLVGYGAVPGTPNLTTSSSATVNRVVARVAANGVIDTTTALTDAATGSNPRGAASVDGTSFWVTGGAGGVRYAAFGGTTSTQLTTTPTNVRNVAVFGTQLYLSTGSGTLRVASVGAGLPTTAGQVVTNLPGLPTSSGSPYSFFLADLNPEVTGEDVLYIADDSGKILKYSLVAGVWTANGSVSASSIRALDGRVSGTTVTLYGASGASSGTGGGNLYAFTDTTGYNATLTGTVTTLATAGTNTTFRGLAFAPGVEPPTTPAITTDPVTQTVLAGDNVTFTVAASGTAPLTYQWRKGGVAITGNSSATTATLTLATVAVGDGGSYDVVVTNAAGSATSAAATLTVNPAPTAPTITTDPQSQTVSVGGNVTFTVVATGTAPLSYQWRKGGTDISTATTDTLTLTNVTLADAGSYDVVVSNGVSPAATSAVAILTVNRLPSVLAAWDFNGTSATTIPGGVNAPLPVAGFGTASLVGGTTATFASGTGSSDSVTTSPPNYAWNNAGFPAAAAANLSAGAQFMVSTVGYDHVAFHFDLRHSNTASRYEAVQYTLDGGTTWTTATFFDGNVGSTWFNRVVDFSTVAGVANNPQFGVRVVAAFASTATGTGDAAYAPTSATGTYGTSGTWRFDMAAVTAQLAGDPVVTLVATDATAAEAGPETAAFRFARDGDTTAALTVNYTLSGTATAADVTPALTGSVTFPAGQAVVDLVLTPVDDAANEGDETLTLTLDAGTGYVPGASTAGTVTITDNDMPVNVAPTLTTQPVAQTATVGDTVTFTVAAAGTPAPTFQWQKDGAALAGATTATLTLPAVTSASAGNYSVVATNVAGTANSAVVALTVNKASATVTLGGLDIVYDGAPHAATVTTAPSGLAVTVTYNGVATVPSAIGTYAVVATVDDTDFEGSANGTLVISRPAPQAQEITFAALPDVLSDAAPITLVATASSELPVTFTLVSGPATLSGRTLTLTGETGTVTVRASQAGNDFYSPAADVTRSFAVAAATEAPRITTQPASVSALRGESATFTVVATGRPAPTYQWRRNGTAIPGATAATCTIAAVQPSDAGSYDVAATNVAGTAVSTLARLTVTSADLAPVITTQPRSLTAVVGRSAAMLVSATGVPAPTYQWYKDGALVKGATAATLTFDPVRPPLAGSYTVVVANRAGVVTSNAATLRVIGRSYAGCYFGRIGSIGFFAIQIRDDNTGVFLGYLTSMQVPFIALEVTVDDDGHFHFGSVVAPAGGASIAADGVGTEADPLEFTFDGAISESGELSGTITGAADADLSATRASDTGTTGEYAGFYQASAAGSAATTYTIVSPEGEALVITQTDSGVDAGTGTIDSSGAMAITTVNNQTIAATIADATIAAQVTTADGKTTNFAGGTETVLAVQRLANLSSRATIDRGGFAIAGLVITGQEAKPVLLRVVGPGLKQFGIADFLARPRLQLYSGQTVIATNEGWSTGNVEETAAAAAMVGGFPLDKGSTDAGMVITLAPGQYTIMVTAADGGAGTFLVEAYDLAAPSVGQKMVNISTRAHVAAGRPVIAGFVVSGTVPKRLLIRGAGPTLVELGITDPVAQPRLAVYHEGKVIAENAGWTADGNAAQIAAVGAQIGAFGFTSTRDAALLLTVEPGVYSVVLSSDSGVPATALVEVYEAP